MTDHLDAASGEVRFTLSGPALAWLTTSFRKVTLQIEGEDELVALHEAAVAAGLRSVLVRDSGRTEFGGVPTLTALGLGPDPADRIDAITGHLKLY